MIAFWIRSIAGCALVLGVSGCVEPSYRYEVTSDGQGRIETRTVPKQTPTAVGATTCPAPLSPNQTLSIDEQIVQLEAKKHQIDQEIARLRLLQAQSGKN